MGTTAQAKRTCWTPSTTCRCRKSAFGLSDSQCVRHGDEGVRRQRHLQHSDRPQRDYRLHLPTRQREKLSRGGKEYENSRTTSDCCPSS
ncbi:MAG: hypothetical protein ACLR8Y_01445 [Alistipes indistinctus]